MTNTTEHMTNTTEQTTLLDEKATLRLVIAIVHRAELDARSRNRKLRRAARRFLTMLRKGARHERN